MDDAARSLAQTLVGRSVARARALVDEAAEQSGLRLSIRFNHIESPVTAEYVYGRISASVRDEIVIAATAG